MNNPMTAPAIQDIDRNVAVRPLPSPRELKAELPLEEINTARVDDYRQQIQDILSGKDSRLLVITGPCSLHDEAAALDYGRRLKQVSEQLQDKLLIVMRAYVEKPRTTTGWKGLAYDPDRDGSGHIASGLQRSRALMLALTDIGLPLATEALNPMTMLYLDDLVSWTAIGARTAESQIHREMISHLPMPVGIKNGTDGSVSTAVNAMVSASRSHHCLGMDVDGSIAMLDTPGNPDTHIVLRGGRGITNYDAKSISAAIDSMKAVEKSNQIHAKVIVDCSHDNAEKQHERQIDIAQNVVAQIAQGNNDIVGVMLESNLMAGKQDIKDELAGGLLYGQSITDPCLGWNQTEDLLIDLHQALN